MGIGYLIPEFPKPSETFVSRELITLQKLGLSIQPFAFDPPAPEAAAKLDAVTRQLVDTVQYFSPARVLRDSIWSWPQALRGWNVNAVMQRESTAKSNRHLRLLRTAALARQLESAGITHLHAHWPYATQVAYQIHKLTGLPFSVSIHAHEVEHDNGHFARVFDAVSFATFCNRAAMERLLASLPPSARERSHLIYHGVDLQRFHPLPFPKLAGPLRIFSAGRLTRSKGFDRLIAACARYQLEGGQVELTILGQGTEEARLREVAAQHSFTSRLHLPGWLPHDQVAGHIGKSHLFALMADTNFHDGLPNVVLEAMSSARPVILSPLPAAEEAITPGREGFILQSASDLEGFAAVLHQVAANPEKLPAMGDAARRRMEDVFDEKVHAKQLKSLFDRRLVPDFHEAWTPAPCPQPAV